MLHKKLKQIKNTNTNLYNHLTKLLQLMIVKNDRNSYQLFQFYSQKIKLQQLSLSQFRIDQFQQLTQYINKTKSLITKPNSGTQDQPIQSGPTGYVPNLLQQQKWLQKCGIGFGEQLTYTIFKSLQKFSITKQIKHLKFFGKINCTISDYYIAQSPAQQSTDQQLSPDVQPKGTGINKITYWITTNLNQQWKQLPTITPTQLQISRKIKYIFTGNPNKQLFTNPKFPGRQSHLLKCQLVRMYYSCTILPRTMYTINPDDIKQIQPANQQWKFPSFAFLSQLSNWVHHPQNILKNGRMTILKPQLPQGVQLDQQKLLKQLQQKDPLQQRLKPLSSDLYHNSQQSWTIKKYGDYSQYKSMSKNPTDHINYGFICIRSLVWRGWHTIYHNKQWISIYIGFGWKSTDDWYYPKQPEYILGEIKDLPEFDQPNFPIMQTKQQGEVQPQQIEQN